MVFDIIKYVETNCKKYISLTINIYYKKRGV